MPYDKDGKYFRKPVFNENFKGLKNKKPSDTTSNKPKTPDEIKKERFKEEYEKMKNYKGSESYQKMMSKYKGSTSKNKLNDERLEYKKAAVNLAKSNIALKEEYAWIVAILLLVIFPPLWPLLIVWFVFKAIGIFIKAYNEK